MSTAVQTMETRLTFSRDQVQLLKDTVCRGSSDDELKLFLQVCQRKSLDPFSRQIWAIKRWDSTLKREIMSFQISIDGLRALAERSGKYCGQGPPMWAGADGVWKDVWLDAKPPAAAKATIYRSDFKEPLVRVALYKEYVQQTREGQPNSMWSKMPAAQLYKCCEAVGLRCAFPELSGLYEPAEMGTDDESPTPAVPTPKRTRPALVRKPQPEPAGPAPTSEVVDMPVEEPPAEVHDKETGTFRVPSEIELRDGLRKGLETIPLLTKAWTDLEADYARAGCELMLKDIQKRFGRNAVGQRTPASMRCAVIVARNWMSDNLHLWLRPPSEVE